MTEAELTIATVLAGVVTLTGLAMAAWAIRAEQRVFLAQGMYLLMFGLSLLAMFLLPNGVLRTSLSVVFCIGAIWWVVLQFWFMRIERRKRHPGGERTPGG